MEKWRTQPAETEERRKSVGFCRKVSAFVDMDISKARTTKVTSVERVESGLHKTQGTTGRVACFWASCNERGWEGALVYHYGDEMIHF